MRKKTPPKKTKRPKAKKKTVKIKYVIPDHIKDCYVNGAWGSISDMGKLHMHLYDERPAIPTDITMEVSEDGSTKEIEVMAGGDLVRLIQSSIVMEIPTAIAIRNWLNGMIESFEKKLPPELKGKLLELKEKKGGKNAKGK